MFSVFFNVFLTLIIFFIFTFFVTIKVHIKIIYDNKEIIYFNENDISWIEYPILEMYSKGLYKIYITSHLSNEPTCILW